MREQDILRSGSGASRRGLIVLFVIFSMLASGVVAGVARGAEQPAAGVARADEQTGSGAGQAEEQAGAPANQQGATVGLVPAPAIVETATAEAATVSSISPSRLGELLESKKGHPVMLALWATWCGPCVKEIPVLNEVHKRFESDGLEIIGLSMDGLSESDMTEGVARVTGFTREHSVSYDMIYYDGEAQPLADLIGWSGMIPFSVIYDARGKVVDRLSGGMSETVLLGRIDDAMRSVERRAGKSRQAGARGGH